MNEIQWIGDVVSLCMCAGTILLLMRERSRYRRNLQNSHAACAVREFNRELQHFGGTGSALPGAFDRHQGAGMGKSSDAAGEGDSSGKRIFQPFEDPKRQTAERSWDAPVVSTGDRYKEAKRLAEMGLDTDAIFERIGLPKGEIELVLKVNRLRSDAEGNVKSGRSFLV